MEITLEEKLALYKQVKARLGAPIRKIQLTDEQMDDLLQTAIEDYSMYMQNWLIENQWSSLEGINLDVADITFALTTRSINYETSFTYAYSKIVGLQANGPWEIKKDYVVLKRKQQIYQIPAGREINEVMYVTPPTMNQSVIDPFLGVWNFHFGAEYIGLGALYVMPAFDILLRAADRNLKNRIIRSEYVYKVTAGPNGTKYLHLLPTPGGKYDYYQGNIDGHYVWYWYYDVNAERQKCIEQNKDIVKLPSDTPLSKLQWSDLNDPAKYWVRRYFTALCKETLAYVRGTFSGNLGAPGSEIKMDYEMFASSAKEEKDALITELKEYLERISQPKMLERKANEAENLNTILKYRPFQTPYLLI